MKPYKKSSAYVVHYTYSRSFCMSILFSHVMTPIVLVSMFNVLAPVEWRSCILSIRVIVFQNLQWTRTTREVPIMYSVTLYNERSRRLTQCLKYENMREKWSENTLLLSQDICFIIQWNLSITTTQWDTSLPSGPHRGGQGPPRWAPEGRNC